MWIAYICDWFQMTMMMMYEEVIKINGKMQYNNSKADRIK